MENLPVYELVHFKPNILLINDLKEVGSLNILYALPQVLNEINVRLPILDYRIIIKAHDNNYYLARINTSNMMVQYRPISNQNLQFAIEQAILEKF